MSLYEAFLSAQTEWQSLWLSICVMRDRTTRGFLAALGLLPPMSAAVPTTSDLPLSGGLTILAYNDLTSMFSLETEILVQMDSPLTTLQTLLSLALVQSFSANLKSTLPQV